VPRSKVKFSFPFRNEKKKCIVLLANVDYEADFDKSVELTFTPNASLRKVFGGVYCASGPGSTPHLKAQVRVLPNQTEEFEYTLLAGVYRIYSQQSKAVLEITSEISGQTIDTLHYNGNRKSKDFHSSGQEKIVYSQILI
jgi:hypothetical protein